MGFSTESSNVDFCVHRYSPNKRWHIDTVLTVLVKVSGVMIPVNVIDCAKIRCTHIHTQVHSKSYELSLVPRSSLHLPVFNVARKK